MPHAPSLLLPVLVERVWGRRDLGGWAGVSGTPGDRRIGEAWLSDASCVDAKGTTLGDLLAADGRTAPPLLAKLLFTAAPLSVQVHPTDAAARATGAARSGKDEAWHVLAAAPGAMVWIGFRHPVTDGALRAAASDGSVISLMRPHAPRVGETILVPAGTMHAIGAGLVLLEVQDAVDVTWRLYDHGRARPLQIDAALAATDRGASRAVIAAPAVGPTRRLLATAPRFVLERCDVGTGVALRPNGLREHILVAVSDGVTLNGHAVTRGMAAFVPAAGATALIAGAANAAVALLHAGPDPTPCIAAA